MKKLFSIIFILLVAGSVGAIDFQIGPAAMYVTPISTREDIPGADTIGLEDFRLGLDARLTMGFLQVALLGLFEAPGVDPILEPGVIAIIPTAGISMKFVLLQLGLGLGPAIELNVGDPDIPDPAELTFHLKGTADIVLGPLSVGIIIGTGINLFGEEEMLAENMDFYVGLVALYKF